MKKIASVLLVAILVFTMAVPAFAASARASDTLNKSISLDIFSNMANSHLKIVGINSNVAITGTYTLRRGSTVVQQISVNARGSIDTTYTKTGLSSGTYTASFSGYCGSDYISISDTKTI